MQTVPKGAQPGCVLKRVYSYCNAEELRDLLSSGKAVVTPPSVFAVALGFVGPQGWGCWFYILLLMSFFLRWSAEVQLSATPSILLGGYW